MFHLPIPELLLIQLSQDDLKMLAVLNVQVPTYLLTPPLFSKFNVLGILKRSSIAQCTSTNQLVKQRVSNTQPTRQ